MAVTGSNIELLDTFLSSPSNVYMGIAKGVLRYIKGTTDLGLWYLNSGVVKLESYHVDIEEVELDGYADSD